MSRFTSGPLQIAYDTLGSGETPVIVIPGWVSHLEYDWVTPEIRSFYQRLANGRRAIRYDKRGMGLSDRPSGPETYALDTQVADLIAVLNAVGVGRAVLFGWSMGGPIALVGRIAELRPALGDPLVPLDPGVDAPINRTCQFPMSRLALLKCTVKHTLIAQLQLVSSRRWRIFTHGSQPN